MTATGPGAITLELPAGWFVLDPEDPDRGAPDRRAALEADVEAWAQEAPERSPHRGQLLEILAGFAAEADEKGALLTAVFWEPGEQGPTAASLMAFKGERSVPHSAEAEVAAALSMLEQPDPNDHAPRQAEKVQLPIGPAARVRILAGSPTDREEDATALVFDATQIWIPLPDEPSMLVITGATPCLIAGDEIARVVDAVAASVKMVQDQEET